MSESLTDVEEKTATAAQVQNFLRRHAMQVQILHAFDIGFHPLRDVCVFRHLHR